MSERLTMGSLFTGLAGLDSGLMAALGAELRWYAEQNEYCQTVLAHHHPTSKCYADVRDVTAASAERVDLLCGGFPCQDISVAGNGEGLDGARSGLWREFDRIIGELRPSIVVVENVSALLARGFGRVLGDLATRGYDAWWDCLPAAAVGAPHRRDRIFVVAWRIPDANRHRLWQLAERGHRAARAPLSGHPEPGQLGTSLGDGGLQRRQGRPERGVREEEPLALAIEGCEVVLGDGDGDGRSGLGAASGHQRASGLELDRHGDSLWPPGPDDMHAWRGVQAAAQPAICGVADGLHPGVLGLDRTQALKALGGAVVPQVSFVVGCAVLTLLEQLAKGARA